MNNKKTIITSVAGLALLAVLVTGCSSNKTDLTSLSDKNEAASMNEENTTNTNKKPVQNDYSKNVATSTGTNMPQGERMDQTHPSGSAPIATSTENKVRPSGNHPQGDQGQAQTGQNISMNGQLAQSAPQEAIGACSGKAVDTSCAFTVTNGSVTGICKTVEDNIIACVPKDAPVR